MPHGLFVSFLFIQKGVQRYPSQYLTILQCFVVLFVVGVTQSVNKNTLWKANEIKNCFGGGGRQQREKTWQHGGPGEIYQKQETFRAQAKGLSYTSEF